MTIAEPTKRRITERFCIRNDDIKENEKTMMNTTLKKQIPSPSLYYTTTETMMPHKGK